MLDNLPVAALPPPFTPPAPIPPEGDPGLLALVRAVGRDSLSTWPRAAYDAPVSTRPFLGRRSVLLNEPAAIRELLVDADARFRRASATQRLLAPLLGAGLFLAEGEAWRHQRRSMAPAFAPRAVAALTPMMAEVAVAAGDRLAAAAARGAPLELLGFCQTLALEVAGRAMLSTEMRRHAGSVRDLLARYGTRGAPSAVDMVLPDGWPSPRDPARRGVARQWRALVDRLIAARRRAPLPAGAPDLLDLLDRAGFDAAAQRDQIGTMLLAGHETTALALFWALALLAQAPAWQAAVAAEADRGGAHPLARAVIEEALRLYPPAFAIVRVARGPDTIAGVALREGDMVVVAPWVLHRHRGLWAAPEAFDPRRFLGAPAHDRFAYLPFGAGPRVCIGAEFALVEASLALSRLVGRFAFALAGGRPVLPVAVVTTMPDHLPAFRVSPRPAPVLAAHRH